MDGVALDTVNRKLYVSDAGLQPKILEMNLDGGAVVTVVNDVGMKPRALVISTENRCLKAVSISPYDAGSKDLK